MKVRVKNARDLHIINLQQTGNAHFFFQCVNSSQKLGIIFLEGILRGEKNKTAYGPITTGQSVFCSFEPDILTG